MTKKRPLIIESDFDTVDPLHVFEAINLPGSKLKEGMVLLDDEGFAIGGLDTKSRATRNLGAVRFLIHDLERGGMVHENLHCNKVFAVAADTEGAS